MNNLDKFVIQQNAVKNATFFLLATLFTEVADQKEGVGVEWLRTIRARTLKELDAAKTMNPADEFSPDIAEVAEVARTIIGAVYDLAEMRHKNLR